MKGYVNAKNMEPNPNIIVRRLNCKSTNKEIKQSKITYTNDSRTEIFLEAIGLFFVLFTFLSKSLSTISLKMHPALLIKTDPQKNSIRYFKYNVEFCSK